MIYGYNCKNCDVDFDLYGVPLSEYKDPKPCPTCSTLCERGAPSPIMINTKSFKRAFKKDSFKSGWNPALNMNITDKGHYKRVLKEKNLIECGNEKPPKQEPTKKPTYFTDKSIKDAVQEGADLSGQEIKALKNGSFDPKKA